MFSAYHEGLTERQLFAHVEIERGENKQPRALDRASLDKLQALTFEPYEVELETARNLFLFSCFTGGRLLRYGYPWSGASLYGR